MTDSSSIINTRPARGLLAKMRIRKKLIILHTGFSICLGMILLLAIRPAMSQVITNAELDQAQLLVGILNTTSADDVPGVLAGFDCSYLSADELASIFDLPVQETPSSPSFSVLLGGGGVVRWIPEREEYVLVNIRSVHARETIGLVYLLVIITLIAGYALMAGALEIFVLPIHVYRPLRRILNADQAVHESNREEEIIDEAWIPADELGSIMRSRNESVLALRSNEKQLAKALDRLEQTAADLHKKNHLLETARKNLEGTDRLASLGMMSAGIAHELNTPLAVVKGLVEKLGRDESLSPSEISLLIRVVGRLESLSEGLLDFARVRPPMDIEADAFSIVDEARTLVMLDRKEQIDEIGLQIFNQVEPGSLIPCDPGRILQVMVNLIRNGVDALISSSPDSPQITIHSDIEIRDSVPWLHIRIEDNGPGIDSAVIDRLFEPFVSSRLDAKGTGLGLAVANGIVREHGGVLVATNQPMDHYGSGAIFEVMLPMVNSTETP